MNNCPSCDAIPGGFHKADCPRKGINPVTGLREMPFPTAGSVIPDGLKNRTFNIPEMVGQWALTPGASVHPDLYKTAAGVAPLHWCEKCKARHTTAYEHCRAQRVLGPDNVPVGVFDPAALASLRSASPLTHQEGGGHYKDMKIQPVEFIHANGIPFMEGNAIKYLCRWRAKGGVEDLKKARHYIDLLIDLEGKAP